MKFAGILFTYYVIILGGVGGPELQGVPENLTHFVFPLSQEEEQEEQEPHQKTWK